MNLKKRKYFYQKQMKLLNQKDYPKYLYRYRSCEEYNITNFEDDLIWMSNAKFYEDPLDAIGIIDNKIQLNQDITFAASFTELKNNDFMWEMYGDNNKGFCLEYTTKSGKFLPILYLEEGQIRISDIPGMNSVFVKTFDWHNEMEWRLVEPNQKVLLPYKEKAGYLRKFAKPTSIILGNEITEKNRMILTEIANKKKIMIK